MRLLQCVLLFFALACHTAPEEPVPKAVSTLKPSNPSQSSLPSGNGTRILFVGNSLTYYNSLPDIVKQVAQAKGIEVSVTMLAKPSYALIDHWDEGEVQKLIAEGEFEFVVVQQGPSSQAEGRALLLQGGDLLKSLCQKYNAKLVFFMVWPARANYGTFAGVITNYTEAATSTQSILCPVGKVWKEYFDTTGDFSYYGADDFHPSQKGSERAAEIIVATLFP